MEGVMRDLAEANKELLRKNSLSEQKIRELEELLRQRPRQEEHAPREEMKQSLSLLEAAMEATADGLLVVSREGTITLFNRNFLNMWRIPESLAAEGNDQLLLKYVADQLKEPHLFYERVMQLYREPEAHTMDLLEFKDGRVFKRYSQPQKIGTATVGRVWSFRDITERKRSEQMLQESERRFRALADHAPVGIFETDAQGACIYFNQAWCLMAGLTVRQALGRGWEKAVHPEDMENVVREWVDGDPAAREASHEYRLISPAGRVTWVFATAAGIYGDDDEVKGYIVNVVDITERKQAEEKLRESETRLKYAQEVAGLGFWDWNFATGDLYWSDQTFVQFGYRPQEFKPTFEKFSRMLHPEDLPVVQAVIREALQSNNECASEFRYIRPTGEIGYLFSRGQLTHSANGEVRRFVGSQIDITEHKQREERIRRSEEFIRNILDTVDESFIVIDHDYRILTANKAYCRQYGRSTEEVIGRYCYEVSHGVDRPCSEMGEQCAVKEAFLTGKPHASLHRHPGPEGQEIYVDTKAFPLMDGSGQVTSVIETINNITEKYLLEEERLKSQKLESIGMLAGGIAHDFNNLLQGIFGYITMAKITHDQKAKSLAMLEQAEKALHQSVNLTNQLLTFSKGGNPVKKPFPLKPVIENTVTFALSGSRTSYRLEIDPLLWQVNGDAGQLGQVIQNIVLNAEQAMPLGGTIRIAARNAAIDDPALPITLARDNYVQLLIEDNGSGIPRQYLTKIFDPYFTTKEKGSGLGLATSYSIIRNHDGQICVDSRVGKGTTFTLYLPALPGISSTEEVAQTSDLSMRKRRVLVMDDEELIRDLATELIRVIGNEAEVAADGEEALARYGEAIASGRPFDLVILDLTIRGGMDGLETLRQLIELDPDVKAVVSSGYSEDAALANYQEHGFKAFLKKPYKMQELRNLFHLVLDSRGQA